MLIFNPNKYVQIREVPKSTYEYTSLFTSRDTQRCLGFSYLRSSIWPQKIFFRTKIKKKEIRSLLYSFFQYIDLAIIKRVFIDRQKKNSFRTFYKQQILTFLLISNNFYKSISKHTYFNCNISGVRSRISIKYFTLYISTEYFYCIPTFS